jgi:WD40 repeat protein
MKIKFISIVFLCLLLNYKVIAQYQNEEDVAWTRQGSSKVHDIISNHVNKLSASVYYYEGNVEVWETESGNNIYSLQSDYLKYNNVAFSHNGKFLLTYASREIYDPGSPISNYSIDSINVSLWDAHSGAHIHEYENRVKAPTEISFTDIGFSNDDSTISIVNNWQLDKYDVATGNLLNVIFDDIAGQLSPQCNYYIDVDYHKPGIIPIWNTSSDKSNLLLNAHSGFTRTVSFSDDEKILVSSGQDDQLLKVWHMPQGKLIKTIEMSVPKVYEGCVSPSGKFFAVGTKDGEVNIWNIKNSEIVQTFNQYAQFVNCISWSPDSKLILIGYYDGTIVALKNINMYK